MAKLVSSEVIAQRIFIIRGHKVMVDRDLADELITNCDRLSLLKHSPTTPYVFTEQGVAMLSSVLKSKKAIQVNIQIMRTFARLKEFLLAHKELAIRFDALEKKFGEHDDKIQAIFEAIRELLDSPKEAPKLPMGFHP